MSDTQTLNRTQRRLQKQRAAPQPPKRRTYAEQALRMDRFDVINFADLTGPKGGEWVKIGGGSFGVVYRGEYLGTEVAIKEVLANNTYDVEKYFERECVLMKEARHPNIVQYIGLTKSPGPDGRIYIISEFVGGNLRSYLADKRKPFDWPLRMSFATDIARAVAYLHARNCLHRDLKGENLLITANDRIKVCDFGFARIAARNEDEMRRISYCGTDGYMSPEILMGVDFSLPSDVFSLGVIFCEILSRHLVDNNTFKREMPGFGLDAAEVREMASKGCPERFIQLSLDCVDEDPRARPDMREVIRRLREIEQEVLAREQQAGTVRCVGSLRGSSLQAVVGSKASKRAGSRPMPPRLPSFSGQVQIGSSTPIREETAHSRDSSGSESDEDMSEALAALEKVGLNPDSLDGPEPALGTITSASTFKVSGHGNPWWSDDSSASLPSLRSSWVRRAIPADDGAKAAENKAEEDKSGDSQYSTSVVRPSKTKEAHAPLPMTMSTHTIGRKAGQDADAADVSESSITVRGHEAAPTEVQPLLENGQQEVENNSGDDEVTQSFMTARSRRQEASLAMATICSSIHSGHGPLYHRFTLIKNGMKRPVSLGSAAAAAASGNVTASQAGGSLLPPGVILANALSKCHVCGRRLGFGAFMDCDDCPYKTHAGCAEYAEPTCQEMAIPTTPVLTPVNASRRGSRGAASPTQPQQGAGSRAQSPATAALAKAAAALGSQPQRTSSPPPPPPTSSTQSSSGRGLFKGRRDKRASKSPPSSAAPVARA